MLTVTSELISSAAAAEVRRHALETICCPQSLLALMSTLKCTIGELCLSYSCFLLPASAALNHASRANAAGIDLLGLPMHLRQGASSRCGKKNASNTCNSISTTLPTMEKCRVSAMRTHK